jgi:hypothetical protein
MIIKLLFKGRLINGAVRFHWSIENSLQLGD